MFCAEDQDDLQFKTVHTSVPDMLHGYIDDVVLAKRLREVLALRGFRRITPEAPSADDDRFKGYHQDQDLISLSNTPQSWLPAIEMLGEGIFIRLNENRLKSGKTPIQSDTKPWSIDCLKAMLAARIFHPDMSCYIRCRIC